MVPIRFSRLYAARCSGRLRTITRFRSDKSFSRLYAARCSGRNQLNEFGVPTECFSRLYAARCSGQALVELKRGMKETFQSPLRGEVFGTFTASIFLNEQYVVSVAFTRRGVRDRFFTIKHGPSKLFQSPLRGEVFGTHFARSTFGNRGKCFSRLYAARCSGHQHASTRLKSTKMCVSVAFTRRGVRDHPGGPRLSRSLSFQSPLRGEVFGTWPHSPSPACSSVSVAFTRRGVRDYRHSVHCPTSGTLVSVAFTRRGVRDRSRRNAVQGSGKAEVSVAFTRRGVRDLDCLVCPRQSLTRFSRLYAARCSGRRELSL